MEFFVHLLLMIEYSLYAQQSLFKDSEVTFAIQTNGWLEKKKRDRYMKRNISIHFPFETKHGTEQEVKMRIC